MQAVLPTPRQPRKLPVVPSPGEVVQFPDCVAGVHHRAILTACYAAGLRISEAVSLRPTDIDSRRMVVRVDQGKGRKDRYVMLSPRLLEILRDYWRRTRPAGGWLFPGRIRGRHLGRHAVNDACGEALRRSGLAKPITPHNGKHGNGDSIPHLIGNKAVRLHSTYHYCLFLTPFKIARNLSGAARTDPFLIPGRDLAASTASFSLDQLGGVSPSSGCFDSPAKLTLFAMSRVDSSVCIPRACRQCWNFVATARQYGFLIIVPQRSLIRLPGLEAGEAPSLPIWRW